MKNFLVCILIALPLFASNSPWELLLQNRPYDALEIFTSTDSLTPQEHSSYQVGAYITQRFLGESTLSPEDVLTQGFADSSLAHFMLYSDVLIDWCLSGKEKGDSKNLKMLNAISQRYPIIAPFLRDLEGTKLLGRGEFKKAEILKNQAGFLSSWQVAGPFENTEGRGFATVYPPEKELDEQATYEGKNGIEVSWFKTYNKNALAQIGIDTYYDGDNAVFYFATTVESLEDQKATIVMGHTGAIKLFVNGVEVVTHSTYEDQNIGSVFLPVTLKKGKNTFLVKLAEKKYSASFSFALLDSLYHPTSLVTQSDSLVMVSESISDSLQETFLIDTLLESYRADLQEDSYRSASLVKMIVLLQLFGQQDQLEVILNEALKKYPQSAFLYEALAKTYESQERDNLAQQMYRQAYQLLPEAFDSWKKELYVLTDQKNTQKLLEFLQKSTPSQKESLNGRIGAVFYAQFTDDRYMVDALLDEITQDYGTSSEGSYWLEQWYTWLDQERKSIEILSKHIQQNRVDSDAMYSLARLLRKHNETKKTIETYLLLLKTYPMETDVYYYLADYLISIGDYSTALMYVNDGLAIGPYTEDLYALKGSLLERLQRVDEAIDLYKEGLTKTSYNFSFWESMQRLQEKPTWQELAPLPDIETLLMESKPWLDTLHASDAYIAYYHDYFRYPRGGYRDRIFAVIYLANHDAVEKHQERDFGSYTTVLQAYTIKADGRVIEADNSDGHVVFTATAPGDYILYEVTDGYYKDGDFTDKIAGRYFLQSEEPVYHQSLRFITPHDDTVSYEIPSDMVTVTHSYNDAFTITSFTTPPLAAEKEEELLPDDFDGNSVIRYTDFTSWQEIAQWYNQLTEHRGMVTPRLRTILDSLFSEDASPLVKIRKIHEYITQNIVYSSIDFRQSGFVPQTTSQILTTKLGDCKDVALLGTTMLRASGISAHLVLVNTRLHNYLNQKEMYDQFDHAILAAELGDTLLFVDLTDNQDPVGILPMMDQGALALMVTDTTSQAFLLPYEAPHQRYMAVSENHTLDSLGGIAVERRTKRLGYWASQVRYTMRYTSPQERFDVVQQHYQLANMTTRVDSVQYKGLDSLDDTVQSYVTYTSDNRVILTGKNALYRVDFFNSITSALIPQLDNRTSPVDLSAYPVANSHMVDSIVVRYPHHWTMVNKPTITTDTTTHGAYSLSFTYSDTSVTIVRDVTLQYNRAYSVEEFKEEAAFLQQAAKSDVVYLIFEEKE